MTRLGYFTITFGKWFLYENGVRLRIAKRQWWLSKLDLPSEEKL